MKSVFTDFRGQLRALHAVEDAVVFVTEHPDGHPTAVYTLDPDKHGLTATEHPGGTHLAGTDAASHPIAPLFKGLASAEGAVLTLGKKTFELPAAVRVIASDPTGRWVVAGCLDGTVAVFHAEKTAFTALESAKLHRGEVTALCWEPEEPRFWSAGADNQLLVTHARGELEPIDRAGKNGHDGPVRALVIAGDALLSAGDDSQMKVWDRGSRKRPSTVKSAGRAIGLAPVKVDGVDCIAVGTSDTVRLYSFEKGKVEGPQKVFHGALARVDRDLGGDATARRGAADTLAGWDDTAANERLTRMAKSDADHKLRAHAIDLLARSSHPRGVVSLEGLISDKEPALRMAAWKGLIAKVDTLGPLRAGLDTGHADIGVQAIAGLQPRTSETATDYLLSGLDHRQEAVRIAVLDALDARHPDGIEATRLALGSKNASTRRRALLRLLGKDRLVEAQRLLARATEDDDADVRHAAYHLRVLAYPNLEAQLRYLDSGFDRAVHGLRTWGEEKPKKHSRAKKAKNAPETVSPLVQGLACRQADTAVRAAGHLALLGDGRALGALLQLSCAGDVAIRGRAAAALAYAGDDRALVRLRALLRDGDASVRDAAFTAVAKLLSKTPLDAVEAGFVTAQVDVRKRALALLVKSIKGTKPSKRALTLLQRALDDSDAKVRSDAFKATLAAFEGAEDGLRFALKALSVDVRRQAVTEAMAQVSEGWAYTLLLEGLDDPDSGLRSEVFEFLRKKAKGRKPDAVVTALSSAHPDRRKAAATVFAKKLSKAAVEHLTGALADVDKEVRAIALEALQRADATESILGALDSEHDDVRIGAAATLAQRGDGRALPVLMEQIARPEPEVGDLKKIWARQCEQALEGLAWLGDAKASDAVAALLGDRTLKKAAARALPWVASVKTLRAQLQASGDLARDIALGLAWRGEDDAVNLVFDGKTDAADAIAAAVALGDPERLRALLDGRSSSDLALAVLALHSWATGSAEALVAALPAADSRIRLVVAGLLQAWNDPEALQTEIARAVGSVLPLPEGQLSKLARAVAHAEGMARVVVIRDLRLFTQKVRNEAAAKELASRVVHHWNLAVARFPTLDALPERAATEATELDDLVLGTLLSLSSTMGSRTHKLRAAALRRLAGLVEGEARYDLLVPALRDPNAEVRQVAFELTCELEGVAEEALATGHGNLERLALAHLAQSGGSDVLEEVLVTRNSNLALVALQQLTASGDLVKAAKLAVTARFARARQHGVDHLAAHYGKDSGPLAACLDSDFADVQRLAAFAMGSQRDERAKPRLIELLQSSHHRRRAVSALTNFAQPDVANALLDALAIETLDSRDGKRLLEAVGQIRCPEVAERVVEVVRTQEKFASAALDALLEISGYDQSLNGPATRADLDHSEQHPRHEALFGTWIDLVGERGDARRFHRVRMKAGWAPSATAEPLARLFDHANDALRHDAIAAYGRLMKLRGGDGARLSHVLKHPHPQTSFEAAVALALAGDGAGMTVLLAAVDTLPEIRLRNRAVEALGELADARALDKLVEIVSDPEHALVEEAARALGRLHEHDDADRIQSLLLDLSRKEGTRAERALQGLRWVGTPTAWARIREATADDDLAGVAAELLEFDPDDPSDLFTKLCQGDYYWIAETAAEAWRRRVGPDSLEPDYVFARCSYSFEDDTVERLSKSGEPDRLLEVVCDPECRDEVRTALLLGLSDAKIASKALVKALESPLEVSVATAARLLGRRSKLAAGEKKALTARAGAVRPSADAEGLSPEAIGPVWWAAARHGILDPVVAGLKHPERAVRRRAAEAARVAVAAAGALVEARADLSLAARGLGKGADVSKLIENPAATDAAVQGGASVPDDAVLSSHKQGVVLPHLVGSGEAGAFSDALASEVATVRLGAIEALGQLGETAGEDLLVAFARDENHLEEERKLAWRCVRRSRRKREART